jgi:hypothetical protein
MSCILTIFKAFKATIILEHHLSEWFDLESLHYTLNIDTQSSKVWLNLEVFVFQNLKGNTFVLNCLQHETRI